MQPSRLDDVAFEFAQWPLRFKREDTEREWLVARHEEIRPHVARGTITSLVGWIVGLAVAAIVYPEQLRAVAFVVVTLILPTHGGQLLSATRANLVRMIEPACGAGIFAAGLAVAYVGEFLARSHLVTAGGLLLCTQFAGPIFRLSATVAVITVFSMVGAVQALLIQRWTAGALGGADLVVASAIAWLGVLYGTSAAYVGELEARRGFVQRKTIDRQQRELQTEKERSERLLRNILPDSIANRLRERETTIADAFGEVSVLFADIVGFTSLAERLSPGELVKILDRLFTAFDDLATAHGLEKIKTIGDAYMAAAGVPEPRADHAAAAVNMAMQMALTVDRIGRELEVPLRARVGVHSGPVVAGVIGRRKFSYDLWGDTVNTASRMESHGVPGRVHVTQATYLRLRESHTFEARGPIEVKGKGQMETWLLAP